MAARAARHSPPAQTTLNEYNAFGDLVRIRELVATSPSVYADTYLYYDRLGQKVAQVDQASYLTIFEYDETGDLKRQVEYARPRTGTLSTTTYGTVVTTTRANSPNDPAGYDRETTFAYDQLNRKVTETRVGVEYFSVSGTTVSSPTVGNSVTTYGYDALGNLTSVKDNNNATTYTYYDVLGRTIAIADPSRDPGDGTTLIPLTRLYVDVFGNVVQQVAYGGGAVSIPASGLPTAARRRPLRRIAPPRCCSIAPVTSSARPTLRARTSSARTRRAARSPSNGRW